MSLLARYYRMPESVFLSFKKAGKGSPSFRQYPCLDLDKGWDLLHYLLTAKKSMNDSPFSIAIHGQLRLRHSDLRIVAPSAVKTIARDLRKVGFNILKDRMHSLRKREAKEGLHIYSFDGSNPDDALLEAESNLVLMRKFYTIAAEKGEAILVDIS